MWYHHRIHHGVHYGVCYKLRGAHSDMFVGVSLWCAAGGNGGLCCVRVDQRTLHIVFNFLDISLSFLKYDILKSKQ